MRIGIGEFVDGVHSRMLCASNRYTSENTMVVARSQFLCIEICRNRLGFNDNIRDSAVVDDLRCRLQNLLVNLDLPLARSIISRLSRDFGVLDPSLARASGWWSFLTKLIK